MLGDVQTEDAPEDPQSEKPEIEGDAGHQAKQGRHGELEGRAFHRRIMGIPTQTGKGQRLQMCVERALTRASPTLSRRKTARTFSLWEKVSHVVETAEGPVESC
jgi:hypothetical protein